MSSIAHIYAIFVKQVKDSLRNRMIAMVFVMFPILALVFKGIVSEDELNFILPSFVTMNTVIIPIIFMSSIVAEEKEKHSLQMLMMSNIKAWEYLIGVGFCVFFQALISSCFFIFIASIPFGKVPVFILSAIVGICCSLLIGAIIAILSKNQMSVGPITAPVSMVIGLLPMFSAMNSRIETFAKMFYSYYVRNAFLSLKFDLDMEPVLIVTLNFLVLLLTFIVLYKFRKFSYE